MDVVDGATVKGGQQEGVSLMGQNQLGGQHGMDRNTSWEDSRGGGALLREILAGETGKNDAGRTTERDNSR